MSRLPGSAVLTGLLLLPGCSNAPVAGTLDCLFPSRFRPAATVPDLGRELGRERDRDLEPIRPFDRVPSTPTDDPLRPLDPPRPIRDGGRDGGARLGDPIGRELNRRTAPVPRDGTDAELPLLPPPVPR